VGEWDRDNHLGKESPSDKWTEIQSFTGRSESLVIRPPGEGPGEKIWRRALAKFKPENRAPRTQSRTHQDDR